MSGPKYAIVDPADYKRLRKYEWFVIAGTSSFYAFRQEKKPTGGKFITIYMHHEIIQIDDGLLIDHKNQNSMDNRKANLRAATQTQNIRNRKKFSKPGVSKYKGIYRDNIQKRWVARITYEKKKIYLGSFRNEIDAARAYDEAAKKYHGEFACLNFPE